MTADDQSKVYGAADPVLTYTASGTLYYADGFGVITGVTLSTATGAAATAGTHTITASGGTAANYAINHVAGTLTITAKAASVTPDASGKTYGDGDPAFLTGTLAGFLPTDGVSATYSRVAGENVGTYPISATLASTGLLSNYAITANTADFTITQKALEIIANSFGKEYGSLYSFAGTEFTTVGLVPGDSVTAATLTSDGAAAAATVVGSPYAIVAGDAVGTGLGNYTITYIDGTLTVDNYNGGGGVGGGGSWPFNFNFPGFGTFPTAAVPATLAVASEVPPIEIGLYLVIPPEQPGVDLKPLVPVEFVKKGTQEELEAVIEAYEAALQYFEDFYEEMSDEEYAFTLLDLSAARAAIQAVEARLLAEAGLEHDLEDAQGAYELVLAYLPDHHRHLDVNQREALSKVLFAIVEVLEAIEI